MPGHFSREREKLGWTCKTPKRCPGESLEASCFFRKLSKLRHQPTTLVSHTSLAPCRERSLRNWRARAPSFLEADAKSLQFLFTLGGPCFQVRCAERCFSTRTVFSLPGSLKAVTVFKASPRPLSQNFLGEAVTDGSQKSTGVLSVDTPVFKRRELFGVLGERLLYFLFPSVTTFTGSKRYLEI